jgi:hypothetical protein
MQTVKTQTSKAAQWERLRRELLRRIVQNEAQRRTVRGLGSDTGWKPALRRAAEA